MRALVRSLLVLSLAAPLGCSSGGASTTGSGGSGAGGGAGGSGGTPDPGPVGGDRPVEVRVPPSASSGEPLPLLILLHGYSVNGTVQELYLQLAPLALARGFLYAHPDGTVDADGKYFWNATDACCNFYGSTVDDSAYLSALIDEIKAKYPVDPRRVYLLGHSNGGFMSYRMACDHADQIAAVVSLAGATWSDATKCTPSEPVSVLQIHGTDDPDVAFDGDSTHPGAADTVEAWAAMGGCSPTPDTSAAPMDVDAQVDGEETLVTRYAANCDPGGGAELWAIQGGGHIPAMTDDAKARIIDFLEAHAKP